MLREIKKIKKFIDQSSLNLNSLTILVEIGSGNFIWTPFIAYYAGAKEVFCVIKDSKWGTRDSILKEFFSICKKLGVDPHTFEFSDTPDHFAHRSDIIMNLGFVRPLNQALLSKMKGSSVVSLVVEPWEVRCEDVDRGYLEEQGIPFCGTNENNPHLNIFRYVGLLAIKLLLEKKISIFESNIILISSSPFLEKIKESIIALGGNIIENTEKFQEDIDAVIIAEQRSEEDVWEQLDARIREMIFCQDIPLIHISGKINEEICKKLDQLKYPQGYVPPMVMTKTTDYVSAEPVIKLHGGAMRASELLWREFQKSDSAQQAVQSVVDSGWGLI